MEDNCQYYLIKRCCDWKDASKKNYSAHKRSLCETGSGPYNSELMPLDEMLRQIVPEDFEENMFDSDAMVKT